MLYDIAGAATWRMSLQINLRFLPRCSCNYAGEVFLWASSQTTNAWKTRQVQQYELMTEQWYFSLSSPPRGQLPRLPPPGYATGGAQAIHHSSASDYDDCCPLTEASSGECSDTTGNHQYESTNIRPTMVIRTAQISSAVLRIHSIHTFTGFTNGGFWVLTSFHVPQTAQDNDFIAAVLSKNDFTDHRSTTCTCVPCGAFDQTRLLLAWCRDKLASTRYAGTGLLWTCGVAHRVGKLTVA